jgi:hypothetical protein
MAIKARRSARRQRQLVPGNVVCMGVRDEATRLPSANVDAQSRSRQKEAGVVVKHYLYAEQDRRYPANAS